jgi:hypothetical protein
MLNRFRKRCLPPQANQIVTYFLFFQPSVSGAKPTATTSMGEHNNTAASSGIIKFPLV